MAQETQAGKLKEHEKERDFFCLVSDAFRVFARRSSIALGSAWAFAGAVLVILVWILTGPTFHFSDTWQLIINTATTIVTFLMVFLIQNTQNRDAKAVHLKLDEVIRALKGARNQLVDLENLSDEDLKKREKQFQHLAEKGEREGGRSRDGTPVKRRVAPSSSGGRFRFSGLAGSQKNFAARAQPKNLTPTAIRFTRVTTATSVPDEPVTPVCPILARHELHQIAFNLFLSLFVRPSRRIIARRACPRRLFVFKGISEHDGPFYLTPKIRVIPPYHRTFRRVLRDCAHGSTNVRPVG
jgi:low affinity Fe/Cu permease